MSLCQIIPNTRTICYDLSYPLNDETIFWPGGETFSHCVNTCRVSCEMNLMNNDNNNSDYFYSAGVINCPEHGGTHVDAPYHFAEDGITVDLLPLENLIATCRVIDISHKLDSLHSEYSLVAEDILNHENQYGELEPQSIVLIRTGWNKFYSQGAKQYLGFDEKTQGPYDSSSSKLRFPGISSDAAYLFIERKICGVGLDTGYYILLITYNND
jgi:kynurenine formamidase